MGNIYKICLTGGPCSGKTTALSKLRDRFQDLGFTVFIAPEAATQLILGGMGFPEAPSLKIKTQETITKLQIATEDVFNDLAKTIEGNVIVFYDRGVIDAKAFVEPHIWQGVLDKNNWNEVALRDQRYDAVIHLVTTAIGAPQFYTLENNAARRETPEQAAQVDLRLQAAWTGHPHLRVIDNSTDFDGKMRRTIAAICRVVGVPEAVEHERKYLVKAVHWDKAPVTTSTSEIWQVYLKDGSRLRRRGQNGSYTYTHTFKGPDQGNGKRAEYERKITPEEYSDLFPRINIAYSGIEKTRTCFLWNNQYFELDEFISPIDTIKLLEIELDEDDTKIDIPPFVEILADVTDDKRYSNAQIALHYHR